MCVYIYIYIYIYIYTHTRNIHTHISITTESSWASSQQRDYLRPSRIHFDAVCMYTYMHFICMYAMYIFLYLCMYVCVYVCMYVMRMYVCTHNFAHVRLLLPRVYTHDCKHTHTDA